MYNTSASAVCSAEILVQADTVLVMSSGGVLPASQPEPASRHIANGLRERLRDSLLFEGACSERVHAHNRRSVDLDVSWTGSGHTL